MRYEQRCRERKALLDEALRDAVDVCHGRAEVARLFAFGSYARDEVSPWSDLDLLVVTDGDPRSAVAAIYARGTLGNVIGAQADGWPARLARNPFGESIMRDRKEIYARSEG